MKKNAIVLLTMLVLSVCMSMVAYAQSEEDLVAKTESGINKLISIATTIFWSLLGLLIVVTGIGYAMKKNDPEARGELISKVKGYIIASFLISLALTIAGFLRGLWG